MRLLVCGSQATEVQVRRALYWAHQRRTIACVIIVEPDSEACQHTMSWAADNDVPRIIIAAKHQLASRRGAWQGATIIHSWQPDGVVAFLGREREEMINEALKAGIKVWCPWG